ncbi:MAG: FecR family protein, partial [Bdellovibrionota bacterium]
NEIVLGSNTSLVIERAGATKPGTELSLRQGTVRSSVNRKYSGKDGDIFEVKTPNGVAGVRGTIFNVAYDSKKNMTQVFTERGAVAVTNLAAGPTAKPTMVKAGMFSEVSKTSEPTPAVVAPAQIIESVSPQANDESKDGDSSKSKKSDSSAASGSDGKSDAKTEVKKDDGPAVALAPQPADSTASSDGGRAPASAAPSAAPEAPKTMTSGGSAAAASQSGAAAIKPMDIINNQTASLRKASEEQLRQQRLIEGNLSEVNLTIK